MKQIKKLFSVMSLLAFTGMTVLPTISCANASSSIKDEQSNGSNIKPGDGLGNNNNNNNPNNGSNNNGSNNNGSNNNGSSNLPDNGGSIIDKPNNGNNSGNDNTNNSTDKDDNNSNNGVNTNNPSQGGNTNDGGVNLLPSEPDNVEGVLDKRIIKSLETTNRLAYTEVKSNSFGLPLHESDFLKTFKPFADNKNYPNANTDYFKYDVYNTIANIFLSSDSKLDLDILKEEVNYQASNDSIFIEFEIKLTNRSKLARSFIAGDRETFLAPNTSKTLKIVVPRSQVKYQLNYDRKTMRNYTQWACASVNFQVDDKNYSVLNFVFNSPRSFAIPYYVKDLFKDNPTYADEVKFDLNRLTSSQVKQDINNHFKSTKDSILNYIEFLHPFLKEFAKNKPLDQTISAIAPTVSDLLIKAKFIDPMLAPLVTDLLSNKKGILTLFQEHKDTILRMLLNLSEDSGIPEGALTEILNSISPSMPEETKQIFYDLVKSEFVPVQLQAILTEVLKLVFNDSTLFDFIDAIFGTIGDQIVGLLPEGNPIFTMLFGFLKYVFTKNADGSYKNSLDFLIQDKQFIGSILKIVLPMLGMADSEMLKMIDQMYTNNSNFNQSTLNGLINLTLLPFTEFLANKDNYEITCKYVQENYADVFSYNSQTQQVTYKYELSFVFKKDFRFELLPLYRILPNDLNIGGTNIPISIVMGANVLPLFFTFGVNDALDMTFYANNQYLYLTPIQESNYYTFNYTIPYSVDFKLNMPSGFDTMFREYTYRDIWSLGLKTISWGFIESFAYSFLFPTYTLSGSLNVTYSDWVNYNYLPALPQLDLTFKWNELTESQNKSLSSFIEFKESNAYLIHSKKPVVGNVHEELIKGRKPYLIESKKKELEKMLFTLGSGFDSLPDNLKPVISINPTVDGLINYTGDIGAGVNVKLMEVSVYFPNPRIIDLANSDLTKNIFSYQNLYKKSFSF